MEKDGILIKGKEIVDVISGNIGIVFVYVVVVCGYKIILIMFEIMSFECKCLLCGLGVNFVLIEGVKGMKGVIVKVEEIVVSDLNYYVMLK